MKQLLLLAMLPAALLAQNLEGTWQGAINRNPNLEIRLVFKITKSGDAHQGVLYNLARGNQLNLGAVALQENTVNIAIPGMGGATYQGKFGADGNSIEGTLTQGPNPLPLPLKRATAATAWELPPPPSPPKGMAPGAKLEFEVSTIKPSPAVQPGTSGGFNVSATELRSRNTSLVDLITFAFALHRSQITGLPNWADDRYDTAASFSGDPTDAQLFTMMQNLIQNRFNLSFHMEKREQSVYSINVGKGGPAGIKMTKATNGAQVNAQGLGRLSFRGTTMAGLARQFQQRVLDRPVIDQSGLSEAYDFTLNWTPDEFQFPLASAAQRAGIPAGPGAPPDLFTAFQEQLGMKLESTKAPVDVLVIDKVSKPTEN